MTRTVVIGGGVAGLVAARAAAIGGDTVTVLEASDRLGGLVDGTEIAGIPIDLGAESIATRGSAVPSLLGALGLTSAPAAPGGARLLVRDRALPLPAASVLGIPGSPLADDVRRIIGARAAARAWLDRVTPELHIGREGNLGSLVRRRMGPAVLEDLVRPVVESVYGVDPDEAETDVLLPGLNAALTTAGSLSGAVLSLRSGAPAGAAVAGIPGGVHTLIPALAEALAAMAVEVRLLSEVAAVRREGPSWRVELTGGALDADRVVVATPGVVARGLLADLVDLGDSAGAWPAGRTSRAVALVVDAPDLDSSPLGTGVLVARPRPAEPVALTHSSAKWPWLRELLPVGRHALRLSYRGTDAAATEPQKVLADAGRLFGVPLEPGALVGSAERTWVQDAPRAQIGVRAASDAFLARVAALDGLAVTGAWVAGTGLASIIPHAQAAGFPTSA